MEKTEREAKQDEPKPVADEILDCIEDAVLRNGFADLNIRDAAAQLHCAQKDIYALPHSKNELILMALERFFKRIRDEGDRQIRDVQEPGRRIYEYLQSGVRGAQKMSPATVADIDKWAPARKIWQEHIRLRVEGLNRLVEEGIEKGVFKGVQAKVVSETMLAMANRIREPDFYRNTDMTVADAFRDFYKILLESLLHSGDDIRR